MKQSFKIRHACCREQKTCYSWAVRKTSPYVPCIYSMLEPGNYFRAPFKKRRDAYEHNSKSLLHR